MESILGSPASTTRVFGSPFWIYNVFLLDDLAVQLKSEKKPFLTLLSWSPTLANKRETVSLSLNLLEHLP
jgi:hypothetical protein